jgi:hypothetical protein
MPRRGFDCKGTAQGGEQVIDLVATGYTNYYCAGSRMLRE